MRALKIVAAVALALTTSPVAGRFTPEVPSVVPSVEGWETFSGEVEFGRPARVAVQYEFFVNPARPVIYEVVRYRVTLLGAGGEPDSVSNEKLQWDRNGRDLRRFECVGNEPAVGGCTWREMATGGDEFIREVPVLLQMYAAHNRK